MGNIFTDILNEIDYFTLFTVHGNGPTSMFMVHVNDTKEKVIYCILIALSVFVPAVKILVPYLWGISSSLSVTPLPSPLISV